MANRWEQKRIKTDPNQVHLSLSDAYALLSAGQGKTAAVVTVAHASMTASDSAASTVHEDNTAPG